MPVLTANMRKLLTILNAIFKAKTLWQRSPKVQILRFSTRLLLPQAGEGSE